MPDPAFFPARDIQNSLARREKGIRHSCTFYVITLLYLFYATRQTTAARAVVVKHVGRAIACT